MTKNAKFFREAAWSQLTGKWQPAVIFSLVYVAIVLVINYVGTKNDYISFLSMLLLYPLQYGAAVAFLGFKRTGVDVKIGDMFVGFNDYGRVFVTILLQTLYIVLWSLLLIVPGIIKAISYSQTIYILKDNPELKFNGAIERSMAMMEGHKMEAFLLGISFIGWLLLGVLTLGIGMLWVTPYMSTAYAHFYDYVKEDYERRIAA